MIFVETYRVKRNFFKVSCCQRMKCKSIFPDSGTNCCEGLFPLIITRCCNASVS
jgi:hypothetical protein